jgi:hypothetical protein
LTGDTHISLIFKSNPIGLSIVQNLILNYMNMFESETEFSNLAIAKAVKFLKIYSCQPSIQAPSETEISQLRKALLIVARESEWENLGVCADNLIQGLNALQSYLTALGYNYNFALEQVESAESVYIKFNTKKMNYYTDSYNGNSRGVLVAMQGDNEAIIGTYGYFPLNLFS